ncbi:MAG: MerR family transcriptional regulator [Synergistaceae bacterium]|nr:MerR family transcriptional regulator [Synergistaceae bacterium]MBQ9582245.1 MerR family transcriptional regulator [Synergistaceae bacterium]MBQ9896079.1 MerR family transcriptional regulator [Synergistaceae bacterium]MBR0096095.1 MerR family transcriptional regulator [Synergistaceae bacterium]MBR0221209.1 MerR family transcriptional regulator [Synergistaceae bacterium]
MIYTMMQACEKTGMTYQGLKFYCNEGLVPNVKRDRLNRRIFDEHDIEWIKSLSCLKNCGMSIQEMKEYTKLCLDGAATIQQRKEILNIKKAQLEENIAALTASVEYINKKQEFYDEVLSGKREYFSNLIPCSCQN